MAQKATWRWSDSEMKHTQGGASPDKKERPEDAREGAGESAFGNGTAELAAEEDSDQHARPVLLSAKSYVSAQIKNMDRTREAMMPS